jgi:hypothetical protein
MKVDWSKDHIGTRVIYTDRSGKEHNGTLRDLMQISPSSGKMLDVKLENSSRARFYVPEDMVTLVPDDVAKILGDEPT